MLHPRPSGATSWLPTLITARDQLGALAKEVMVAGVSLTGRHCSECTNRNSVLVYKNEAYRRSKIHGFAPGSILPAVVNAGRNVLIGAQTSSPRVFFTTARSCAYASLRRHHSASRTAAAPCCRQRIRSDRPLAGGHDGGAALDACGAPVGTNRTVHGMGDFSCGRQCPDCVACGRSDAATPGDGRRGRSGR